MNTVTNLPEVVVLKNEDLSVLTYRRIGFALMCLSTIVTLALAVLIGNRIINWLS